MKAIVIELTETKPAYHNASLKEVPRPESLEDDQALLEVSAVSFNHRELWIRKGQYPVRGPSLSSVVLHTIESRYN